MLLKKFDISSLGWKDAADIALQRTDTLISIPAVGKPAFTLWARGMPLPLYAEAVVRRRSIIRSAIDDIEREFDEIRQYLGSRVVNHIVDIGCGHAIIDVFFYCEFRSTISLIDIERTSEQHHDFHSKGAGYTSLAAAKRLLVDNGVPQQAVSTINPAQDTLPNEPADLIISLLSAGFHYPISEYVPFALKVLNPGGVMIFDARKGEGQLDQLGDFREVQTISEHPKYLRVAALR